MGLWAVPRLYRRAILIYVGTIVVPAAAFLWLGLRSFETQRQALVERTNQQVAALLLERTEDAARDALKNPGHPIIQYAFTMKGGVIVDPLIDEPFEESPPAAFDEAERLEQRSPGKALDSYRTLLKAN